MAYRKILCTPHKHWFSFLLLLPTPIPHAALELSSSVCIDFAFVFTQYSDTQYSVSFRWLIEDPIINWLVSPLLSQELSYLQPNFSFSVSVSVQSLFFTVLLSM